MFYLIEKWSQYLLINHHLTECKLKVCITQKILEAIFEQKYFIKPNSFLVAVEEAVEWCWEPGSEGCDWRERRWCGSSLGLLRQGL